MEKLLVLSCFPALPKVINSALGHGRSMELSFEMCSSSRAGAQGQMRGKTAIFFARRYGDREKGWQ